MRKPGRVITTHECPELFSQQRSMLGSAQEAWLQDGLARSQSRWNILAQSLMMARMRRRNPAGEAIFWTDDWNGYPASRTRLLRHLHDARVANPLVVGGDIHSFWANDLKLDFDDPHSPTVATEFIGSSISANPPTFDFAAALPKIPTSASSTKACAAMHVPTSPPLKPSFASKPSPIAPTRKPPCRPCVPSPSRAAGRACGRYELNDVPD